ncbi:MAG: serine/threonine protein kinase [Myxococcota bacterium]|jgi:serine/threonine protein kinase
MVTSPPAFLVLEISAIGTFGTVCVAEDLRDGRLVALKVIKSEHLGRERILARARDEARMMMEFDHPGIVRVYDLVYVAARPMVVMEWVRGTSLSRLLRTHPRGVAPAVAAHLVKQACSALQAAWEATPRSGGAPMRVIHRDIKPSNLLVTVDGDLKLVDFGIAKTQMSKKEAETLSMVLGARGYLAPERLDGGDDAPSVDVYAMGIVLHELLCGEHIEMSLHPGVHAKSVATAIRYLKPPGVDDNTRAALRSLIGQMCAYRGEDRPSHADVVSRLDALSPQLGDADDIRQWTETHLWPLFLSRPTAPPESHPAWEELAFLDAHAFAIGRSKPPQIDTRVAEFIRTPDWTGRQTELDRLLSLHPNWTPEPLLHHISTARQPWWKIWQKEPDPSEIVAVLDLLRNRAEVDAVQQRARSLLDHADPHVCRAAQAVIVLAPA